MKNDDPVIGDDKRRDNKWRRRLTLTHNDRPFLERWGLCHEKFGGFYLHKIADADPGIDLHDHPWTFVSVILRGGYVEDYCHVDKAWPRAGRNVSRRWRRFSIHRVPLTVAHRITAARPNTWTLVFRGPTRRVWGFFLPGGRVLWTDYDYQTRRPSASTK